MAAVQQGMKSRGFPGTKPNPYRERSTVNLHYQLSKYMGTGEPQELSEQMTLFDDLRADADARSTSTSPRCGRSTPPNGPSGCGPRARRSTWNSKDDFAEFSEVDPLHAGDRARPDHRGRRRRRSSAAASPVCWRAHTSRRPASTTIRVIEMAGDFGGVWYWNRFPGIQCDNDAYCYIPLLEELDFMPSKKFADGAEIFQHCRNIGKHFGLYDGALFSTQVRDAAVGRRDPALADRAPTAATTSARASWSWRRAPTTARSCPASRASRTSGATSSTPRAGTTTTPAATPTADWTSSPTSASRSSAPVRPAIQLVPHLGRDAKQLFVFQRTPSSVDERTNPPTDPDWAASLQPGWQEERKRNFHNWSPFVGVVLR